MLNEILGVVKFNTSRYMASIKSDRAKAKRLIIAVCLALFGVCPTVHAQNEEGRSLGELLSQHTAVPATLLKFTGVQSHYHQTGVV